MNKPTEIKCENCGSPANVAFCSPCLDLRAAEVAELSRLRYDCDSLRLERDMANAAATKAQGETERLRAVVGEVLEECARADWAMEPHGPGEVETTVIRSILRRGEVGG